jgi:hypothetical protein
MQCLMHHTVHHAHSGSDLAIHGPEGGGVLPVLPLTETGQQVAVDAELSVQRPQAGAQLQQLPGQFITLFCWWQASHQGDV